MEDTFPSASEVLIRELRDLSRDYSFAAADRIVREYGTDHHQYLNADMFKTPDMKLTVERLQAQRRVAHRGEIDFKVVELILGPLSENARLMLMLFRSDFVVGDLQKFLRMVEESHYRVRLQQLRAHLAMSFPDLISIPSVAWYICQGDYSTRYDVYRAASDYNDGQLNHLAIHDPVYNPKDGMPLPPGKNLLSFFTFPWLSTLDEDEQIFTPAFIRACKVVGNNIQPTKRTKRVPVIQLDDDDDDDDDEDLPSVLPPRPPNDSDDDLPSVLTRRPTSTLSARGGRGGEPGPDA